MKTEGDKKMAKDDVLIKKTLPLQKLLIYINSIAVLNLIKQQGSVVCLHYAAATNTKEKSLAKGKICSYRVMGLYAHIVRV